MSDVPAWATAVIALGSAFVGLVGRAGFEEWRDFRGARRVVVSELGVSAEALRTAKRERAGGSHLPNVISDDGYTNVQLVLARYLPDRLWGPLESVYSRLSPVKTEPAKAFKSEEEGDRLLLEIESVVDQLRTYRFVRGLVGKGVPRNAQGDRSGGVS